MTNYFSSNFKLGILGGGQLGKMLLTETQKLDIYTIILDNNPNAPCSKIAHEFHQGDLQDYDAVYQFGKKVDLLTIEIENVNIDALEQLEKEGLKIYPEPKVIRIIQNKASQKKFYNLNGIPTCDFQVFQSIKDIKQSILTSRLNIPFVWKSARFGYDGNGVKIIRSINDLNTLTNGECITEELIPFENELAVIVARNPDKQVKTYPVSEMEFHSEANQVEYVISPARIKAPIADKAKDIALKVAKAFDFVGLLAVEMFQTKDGEILVNEVAPRVHNSGHYTNESSYTNQFEQHIRSILNLPLGSTQNKVASVMVNLVGEEGYNGDVIYKNIDKIIALEGVKPYIYGKKQTKPFRKMGHVTIVNKEVNKARKIAELVKKLVRVISN